MLQYETMAQMQLLMFLLISTKHGMYFLGMHSHLCILLANSVIAGRTCIMVLLFITKNRIVMRKSVIRK